MLKAGQILELCIAIACLNIQLFLGKVVRETLSRIGFCWMLVKPIMFYFALSHAKVKQFNCKMTNNWRKGRYLLINCFS